MRYLFLIWITALIGCSPVNSLQPFDQTQAAILINEHIKPQARSKLNVHRETVRFIQATYLHNA